MDWIRFATKVRWHHSTLVHSDYYELVRRIPFDVPLPQDPGSVIEIVKILNAMQNSSWMPLQVVKNPPEEKPEQRFTQQIQLYESHAKRLLEVCVASLREGVDEVAEFTVHLIIASNPTYGLSSSEADNKTRDELLDLLFSMPDLKSYNIALTTFLRCSGTVGLEFLLAKPGVVEKMLEGVRSTILIPSVARFSNISQFFLKHESFKKHLTRLALLGDEKALMMFWDYSFSHNQEAMVQMVRHFVQRGYEGVWLTTFKRVYLDHSRPIMQSAVMNEFMPLIYMDGISYATKHWFYKSTIQVMPGVKKIVEIIQAVMATARRPEQLKYVCELDISFIHLYMREGDESQKDECFRFVAYLIESAVNLSHIRWQLQSRNFPGSKLGRMWKRNVHIAKAIHARAQSKPQKRQFKQDIQQLMDTKQYNRRCIIIAFLCQSSHLRRISRADVPPCSIMSSDLWRKLYDCMYLDQRDTYR